MATVPSSVATREATEVKVAGYIRHFSYEKEAETFNTGYPAPSGRE